MSDARQVKIWSVVHTWRRAQNAREAAKGSKRGCTDSGFVPQLGRAEGKAPVYPNLCFMVGLSCSSPRDRADRYNFS